MVAQRRPVLTTSARVPRGSCRATRPPPRSCRVDRAGARLSRHDPL